MSSASQGTDTRVLYLEQIDVETVMNPKPRAKLFVDDTDVEIHQREKALIWTPSRRLAISSMNKVIVIIKTGYKLAGLSLGSMEEKIHIEGEDIAQAFWDSQDLGASLSRKITFNGQPATIILRLRSSASSQSVHAAFRHLQDEMKKFKPLMADWVELHGDRVAKYATAIAELNLIAKMAVGVVRATFELLKEQNKYDNMVSDLVDKVERVLPLVERVDEETQSDDSDLLEAVIRKIYDIILDTAEFACRYVSRNALRRAAKSIVSSEDRDKITELDRSLSRLIEDFDRTVNMEALITVKDSEFTDEDRFLRDRLKPVESGYKLDRCCMSDTRKAVLDNTISWALRPVQENQTNDSANLFWLYGIPGVGKSAVANSLCARLHKEKRLAGSFFCRRDDPNLRDPKYVLPGFIFGLAGEDSNLNPDSAGNMLFLQLLEGLRKPLPYPFVLVIDALDECGEPRTREGILRVLIEAVSRFSWLRVIITSREEHDISAFFTSSDNTGRYFSQDLGKDEQSNSDIAFFAQKQFSLVATRCYLSDWPKKEALSEIVTRAGGLFIYVETLRRLVEEEPDPEEALVKVIRRASGDKEGALYQLYSSTIESKVGKKEEIFQRAMGVIISVASYRPLSDEAVATLAGLKMTMMKALVDNLGSLLYRDNNGNGALRVRHLSIIDFLTDSNCPPEFRVDLERANEKVGVACLATMNRDLKFNICELETSLVSNENIEDLPERVKGNISEALQYSCIHWSSHVCFVSYSANSELIPKLGEFFMDTRPLYWIEVLSVTGKVSVGVEALRQLLLWANNLSRMYYDSWSLSTRQLQPAPPHIYISALPFTPVKSEIWKATCASFEKNLMKVSQGRMELWPSRPVTWTGHTGHISSIAYSPDGRYVVSGSEDKTIRIWDAEIGRAIGEPWKGHTESIISVSYSPDGRHVVSCSYDETIRKWDAETGQAVGEPWRGHTSWARSVTYSPDGRYVVSGYIDGTIQMWDAETGQVVGEPWKGHTDVVTRVVYSPDGLYVLSGSEGTTIRMWDPRTGQLVGKPWTGHTAGVRGVAYSPDGLYAVSSSVDTTIRIWDVKTGQVVGEPWRGLWNWVHNVVYSPDGRYVVSCCLGSTIQMWNVKTGQVVTKLWNGIYGFVDAVAYSPDGRSVISGCNHNMIRMWDADTGQAVGELGNGHTNRIASVVYSPDGRHILSGSEDTTIRMWDAKTGQAVGEPWRGHDYAVNSIVYSPDGRYVVSVSNTIRRWDAETGKAVGEPWIRHDSVATSIVYSPDGRYVVSGSFDRTIQMWDAETGKAIGEPLRGHTSWIHSVAYSPDGRYIISGSEDKTIRIWDAHSQTHRHEHTLFPVQFHPLPLSYHLDSLSDSKGWVHHPEGGLLYWVPEDCRNGIICPAVLSIPTEGHQRTVRLDFTNFRYGTSWADVHEAKE